MGRKKRWHEALLVKFPAGTRERIDAVLKHAGETREKDEDRTDFVRGAVEQEVARRERAKDRARQFYQMSKADQRRTEGKVWGLLKEVAEMTAKRPRRKR